MGNGWATLGGFIMCAMLSFLVVSVAHHVPLKTCAKEHNVYGCEWIAVPVDPEATQ